MKVMELKSTRVAKEIQALRHDRDLSQQQLADMVNVTRATISNIERATQSLSLDLFCRIAYKLNLDPPQLLNRILQPSRSLDLSSDVRDQHILRMIEEAISTRGDSNV